jgi:hypothetical protein
MANLVKNSKNPLHTRGGNRAGTPHKDDRKNPDPVIDPLAIFTRYNSSVGKSGKKFSPEELARHVFEFLNYATEPSNKKLASYASFSMFMLKKHMYISRSTLEDYRKDKKYKAIVEAIVNTQKLQLEERSTYYTKGMPSPILLMLKNLGYQDKVVNENIDMPSFNFNKVKDDPEK